MQQEFKLNTKEMKGQSSMSFIGVLMLVSTFIIVCLLGNELSLDTFNETLCVDREKGRLLGSVTLAAGVLKLALLFIAMFLYSCPLDFIPLTVLKTTRTVVTAMSLVSAVSLIALAHILPTVISRESTKQPSLIFIVVMAYVVLVLYIRVSLMGHEKVCKRVADTQVYGDVQTLVLVVYTLIVVLALVNGVRNSIIYTDNNPWRTLADVLITNRTLASSHPECTTLATFTVEQAPRVGLALSVTSAIAVFVFLWIPAFNECFFMTSFGDLNPSESMCKRWNFTEDPLFTQVFFFIVAFGISVVLTIYSAIALSALSEGDNAHLSKSKVDSARDFFTERFVINLAQALILLLGTSIYHIASFLRSSGGERWHKKTHYSSCSQPSQKSQCPDRIQALPILTFS